MAREVFTDVSLEDLTTQMRLAVVQRVTTALHAQEYTRLAVTEIDKADVEYSGNYRNEVTLHLLHVVASFPDRK